MVPRRVAPAPTSTAVDDARAAARHPLRHDGAIRSPRWRSEPCNGSEFDRSASPSTRASIRPGREGLTGTAPADVYGRPRSRQITIAPDGRPRRQQPRVAPGLPDRLAAGPLRRAPRLREVPGADERRVRRRAALDRGAELVAAPPCRAAARRIAALADVPVGGNWCSPIRPRTTALLIRIDETVARRVQPEVHAPVVRGRAEARGRRAALPVPRGYLRSANRPTIAGPPPRPLPRVVLEIRGDDVYADRQSRRGRA